MSFDPQNPRGAPRPTTPPPTIPPSTPRSPSYVPPQPQRSGPSRNVLLAIGIVVALVLFGLVVLLLTNKPAAGPTSSPSRPPSGSTAPTSAGSPRTSSVPATLSTAGATLPPSFVVVVGPSPGTPEAELLGHVPEALRATCTEQTAASSPAIYMASCSANTGGITVNYSQYASAEIMSSAYQDVFTPIHIDPDSGSCEDHATWPAESSYDVGGAPVGRRLCTDESGQPTIYWTDDRLNILSRASGADPVQLLDFWTNEAGPTP